MANPQRNSARMNISTPNTPASPHVLRSPPPQNSGSPASRNVSGSHLARRGSTNSSPRPASLGQITQGMHGIVVSDSRKTLVPRSTPGTLGKKGAVLTNHFLMGVRDLPPKIYIWNLDLRKTDESDTTINVTVPRQVRRAIELLLEKPGFKNGVFTDYSTMMISFMPLTQDRDSSRMEVIEYYDREEPHPDPTDVRLRISIRITPAAEPLDTKPLKDFMSNPGISIRRQDEFENCLNIMLQRFPSQHPRLTTAAHGTKAFPIGGTDAKQALGFGLDAWRGYVRRGRMLQGGIYLCANTTASAMHEQTTVDIHIANWKPPTTPRDQIHRIEMLHDFLHHLRIQGKFGNQRTNAICDIAHRHGQLLDAHQVYFRLPSQAANGQLQDREITVAQYFAEMYSEESKRLKRGAPVLNVGTKLTPVWWPSDLCCILPGQSCKGLLPFPEQTQRMIQFACRPPHANMTFIGNEGMSQLGVRINAPNTGVGEIANTRLQMMMNMANIPARQLPPPGMKFGGNRFLLAKDAATGRFNMAGKTFFSTGEKVLWTYLVLNDSDASNVINIQEFQSLLAKGIAQYCGYATQKAQPTITQAVSIVQTCPRDKRVPIITKLFNDYKQRGINYIFIVISNENWYHEIKTLGDRLGVQTTCKLRKKEKGKDNQVDVSVGTVANLLLKFNLKTGGENWKIDLGEYGALLHGMILGADCVHPPPGTMTNAPSVAGLVASTGPNSLQFPGIVSLQQNPKDSKQSVEMILGLDQMLLTRLRLWQSKNAGALPGHLILYRDGVGDSQLQQVLDNELPLMVSACKAIYKTTLPKIIIVVVQKRIMVRFYQPPNDKSGFFDVKGNPHPGLVVDQHIVSNGMDDWYATSHRCIQGTSRPAHHIRIYDEMGIPIDALQQLTHSLAYAFARSTSSISVPAPARYADLLCQRAKIRLHEVYFPNVPKGKPKPTYNPQSHFRGQDDIHPELRDTMYYI